MSNRQKIGNHYIELALVDSTNNYAMHLINENMAVDGLVVRADYQSKGKGQHSNVWMAEESKNILLSIILEMNAISLGQQFLVNASFCLSVANMFMQEYEVPDVSIKWPNDIYAGKKKLSGILIENVIRGTNWQYAIIGVGLNINQLNFKDLTNATSLKHFTKKNHSISKCTKIFFKYLNKYYERFLTDPTKIIDEYNALLHGRNIDISYKYKHEIRSGTLIEVKPTGEIEIETKEGLKTFRHKEIELEIR